jgi:hypothetical protein
LVLLSVRSVLITLTPCSTSAPSPAPAQEQEELVPAPCLPKLHSLLNDDLILAEPGDLAASRGAVVVGTASSGISITRTPVAPVGEVTPWLDTPRCTLAGSVAA